MRLYVYIYADLVNRGVLALAAEIRCTRNDRSSYYYCARQCAASGIVGVGVGAGGGVSRDCNGVGGGGWGYTRL